MPTIEDQNLTIAISDDVAARVFERAARSSAKIRIQLRGEGDHRRIDGKVITVESKSITVDAGNQQIPDTATNSFCDATLSIDQGLYVFSSSVLNMQSCREGGSLLELARPASLQLLQRRRFVRARLSTSTTIRIEPESTDEFDGFDANLLNLAEEGLAARTELKLADRLMVDQPVRVRFRSDASPGEFNLRAILRRKTAAGDRGQVILGLTFQFEEDECEIRETIRDAVRHYIL